MRSATRRTIRFARWRGARSRSCSWCIRTRPTASLASRRSGTPGLPRMRCSRPAMQKRRRAWRRRCNGSSPCRCSTSRATGLRGGRTCAPAAGRSSTPIRIIPTSTTPRWWRWRWSARRASMPKVDHRAALARAEEWILGLQSKNGAWGAFDADNEYYYLNNIPFADHGALLDPPTEDVTARCVSMLAQSGKTQANSPAVAAGVDYLKRTQLAEGSWYGRWGMNYIYGTWSVLCALNAAGVDHAAPEMRKAADWLDRDPERRRRLGRGRLKLQARLQGLRARAEHRLADRLGVARADGDRRHGASGGAARHRLSDEDARPGRLLGRGALHRDRFPARVLPALPRLPAIFSALGDGALSQSRVAQRPHRQVRDSHRRHCGALAKASEPGIQLRRKSLVFCISGSRASLAPRNDGGVWPSARRSRTSTAARR